MTGNRIDMQLKLIEKLSNSIMKLIIITACLFLFSGSGFNQSMQDLQSIKAKLYRLSAEAKYPEEYVTGKRIEDLISNMSPEGNWPDINYQDKSDANWLPAEHWVRLLKLAVSYRNTGSSFYGNAEVRNTLIKGISWWLTNTPVAKNYWWNAIGVPGYMGEVYILLESELSDSLKIKGAALMKLSVKPTYYDYHGVATGQNLLWEASAHLYASCILNDIEGVKRVFKYVANEIVITENEGIQPDYSFYQHGQQNYAFGYGKGFSTSGVRFFYLANQTAFQFSQDKIDIMAHYLLDGQQWMTRYAYLEYTAMGREISRKGISRSGILIALQWMMDIDPAKKQQYQAFYERLSGNTTTPALVGNRYFWRSDLMVHQRKDYYFSLKTTSNCTLSGESGNGENLKGYYQGNGTYYLVQTGNEYKEIFPIFNWRQLPGGLIPQVTTSIPLFNWGAGARGASSFVYGISDSMYGCYAYDYQKEKVTARRAWFLFDQELVCLANSIQGDSLYQSINQCILNGAVWDDGNMQSNGHLQKVFHDSVGYCILSSEYPVVLKTAIHFGSWKDINQTGSPLSIEKKVFTLGIDLGPTVKDASLAYAIVPAVSLPAFKSYTITNHIAILQNNHQLQAVYQKDLQQVQAVFYTDTTLLLPWYHLQLKMKRQGLLLIKVEGNTVVIDYGAPFPRQRVELKLHSKLIYDNTVFTIAPESKH